MIRLDHLRLGGRRVDGHWHSALLLLVPAVAVLTIRFLATRFLTRRLGGCRESR